MLIRITHRLLVIRVEHDLFIGQIRRIYIERSLVVTRISSFPGRCLLMNINIMGMKRLLNIIVQITVFHNIDLSAMRPSRVDLVRRLRH